MVITRLVADGEFVDDGVAHTLETVACGRFGARRECVGNMLRRRVASAAKFADSIVHHGGPHYLFIAK